MYIYIYTACEFLCTVYILHISYIYIPLVLLYVVYIGKYVDSWRSDDARQEQVRSIRVHSEP